MNIDATYIEIEVTFKK